MHPILQHLLDFLSRRLVLLLILLRVVERGLVLSVLDDASFLVVRRCCRRRGDGRGFGSIYAIGVTVQGRYASWVVRVRFYLERAPARFHRRVF